MSMDEVERLCVREAATVVGGAEPQMAWSLRRRWPLNAAWMRAAAARSKGAMLNSPE